MRRLKTVRRPPIYPKTPGHLPCSSLTHPLPLSSRRPSVSFGGFGLRPNPHQALPVRKPRRVVDNQCHRVWQWPLSWLTARRRSGRWLSTITPRTAPHIFDFRCDRAHGGVLNNITVRRRMKVTLHCYLVLLPRRFHDNPDSRRTGTRMTFDKLPQILEDLIKVY